MAKPKFPSPANTPKNKKPSAPSESPTTIIEGVPQENIQINYKKNNIHIVHGVHALKNGLNHFPKNVWESHKNHPANKALIDSGDISLPSDSYDPQEEDSSDEVVEITPETETSEQPE